MALKTAWLTVSILVLWLSSGAQARADSARPLHEFAIRTWGKADGLPDDSVAALLQTRDGYLWVGTSAGLVKFDGTKFTAVALSQTVLAEGCAVSTLCQDASGQVWIGTATGGLFCQSASGTTHYGTAQGLLSETVTSLAVEPGGCVWVGTPKGANRFHQGRFESYTTRQGLAADNVSNIRVAPSGAVRISTAQGSCLFQDGLLKPLVPNDDLAKTESGALDVYEDRRGNLWAFGSTYLMNLNNRKRFNYFRGEGRAVMRVWSLCEGRGGQLWIGTSGRGLFRFDGTRFEAIALGETPSLNDVRALCEDYEGNIWVGVAGGGLVQLRAQNIALLTEADGLPSGRVTCLAQDTSGNLFVGLENGKVCVNRGELFEPLSEVFKPLRLDAPTSLCASTDGDLWVGSRGFGLYHLRNGRATAFGSEDGLADDGVLALCPGTDGTVWAGTCAGSLHELGGRIEAPRSFIAAPSLGPITALCPAAGGGLWAGTDTGMLCLWTNRQLAWQQKVEGLAGKPILALFEDAARRLWIGSAGGGLACRTEAGWMAWGRTNGLPDDTVSAVISDRANNLWIQTLSGISRIARRDLSPLLTNRSFLLANLVYETKSGIVSAPVIGGPRALRSKEGRLWFGNDDGLLAVDPSAWNGNEPPLPVYIERILLNGEPLARGAQGEPSPEASERLEIPANLISLDILFTAIDFGAPGRLRFRYKLDGFNADWVETKDRQARYGRLPSGEYVFHVSSRAGSGPWQQQEATVAFRVLTPLWRAPGVLALLALGTAGSIAAIVRAISHRRLRVRLARAEAQQAMERERLRIAQDMHDELGSKLARMSFLGERARLEGPQTKQGADRLLSVADTARELMQSLNEIVWAVNPRNDTLEHLGAYLAHYATGYFADTEIECRVQLPAALPAQAVSAELRHNVFLAFKESLSNVLKHSDASCVQIAIGLNQNVFCIVVADNGKGFSPAAEPAEIPSRQSAPPARPGGNGLLNLRQRMADIQGDCKIQSQPGAGTTITLSFPLADIL